MNSFCRFPKYNEDREPCHCDGKRLVIQSEAGMKDGAEPFTGLDFFFAAGPVVPVM